MSALLFVKLTKAGEARVLDGKEGAIFHVVEFKTRVDGRPGALVRDYRYKTAGWDFALWSLNAEDFEVMT